MISIRIGENERTLDDGDIEGWIAKQLGRRSGPACVSVSVREGDVDVRLFSGACPPSGGGSWQPNNCERVLIDLWEGLGFDDAGVPPPCALAASLKWIQEVQLDEGELKQKRSELRAARVLQKDWAGMPDGPFILREAPDLALCTDEQRVGIEVTELRHPPDGSGIERQQQEAVQQAIARRTEALLREAEVPPVHVQLHFRTHYGLVRGRREDALRGRDCEPLARRTAEFVLQHIPQQDSILWVPCWPYPELRNILDNIHIERRYSRETPVCTAGGGGGVPAIERQRIRERLRDKELKLVHYGGGFDAYWLLITTGFMPFSYYFDYEHAATQETLAEPIETAFDRVFIVDVSSTQVHALTRPAQ